MSMPERMAPQDSNEVGRSLALAALLGRIEPALGSALGLNCRLSLGCACCVAASSTNACRLPFSASSSAARARSSTRSSACRSPHRGDSADRCRHVYCLASRAARHRPLQGNAPSREFAVHAADEIRDVLFRFVAEDANPENRLGVERVELFYPADILADGTVIIDTPGVGSTLRHNTEAAWRVMPECDAAFFVVSADPPITESSLNTCAP